ncbi:magnesium transporter CorA family protein [Deinococcus detaillensis]|uniref:magnesium transporter CorA family protein n=1 Tax=Deinococcus detaillensis TaxID=2592048 RepID=UPI001CDC93F2|nr:magnesium transporter CorA family protein [Deinococcus detaillensis]
MIRVKTLSGEELDWTQVLALLPAAPASSAEQKTSDSQKPVPQNVWVDVQAPTPEEWQSIRAAFPLHPLAMEDAQEEGHWSRFESYPAHDFITYRTLSKPEECDEFTERISLFLFQASALHEVGSILSISRRGTLYLGGVWKMAGRETVNTPAEVAYELLDHGTDTFGLYANALETRIEGMQEQVFKNERRDLIATVFEYKHDLAKVRRLCSDAREALLLLVRHGHAEGGDAILYRDALSNLDRAVLRLEGEREALTSLLDMSLGFQGQRMNEVIRTLTVVSTIFLPLTFLAGVWGMNFKLMPELQWPYGYGVAWGSFVLVGLMMALYFKRRGWW